ncbi:MAG: hypothetical protein IKI06_01910 [Prevotella sp.]|nr:hypothetical protein [Prevotella sp.]
MKQRILRAAMLLLVTMFTIFAPPSEVWADNVTYINANGTEQTVDATAVTDETTAMGSAGQTTWYYVSGHVNNVNRIELAGTVNLILVDNCNFYVGDGLHLSSGNTLNVYTQNGDNGLLRADKRNNDAAIGGNGGADAVGQGGSGEDAGDVNIYGGYVYAYGNLGGGDGGDGEEDWQDAGYIEGIGGNGGSAGNICIYGGKVYVYNAMMGGGRGAYGNNAFGSDGGATISLSWTKNNNSVRANKYNGTVTLQKAFTDESCTNYPAGPVSDNSTINEKELLSANAVIEYAQTSPTCTQDGYSQDFWFMPATQQYFADADCTQEITKNDVVIPATGHVMDYHAAKSATFTTAGYMEYWYCENCKKYFGDQYGKEDLYLDDASSLTYSAEGNSTDGYSIRVPKMGKAVLTLDNSVTSFKIYDDGGEGGSTTDSNQPGNYSNGCTGQLVLIAPENYAVQLTGDVMTEHGWDYLTVYRGTTADDSNILLNRKHSDGQGDVTSIGSHTATSMLLSFISDGGTNYAGLDLTATLIDATPHSITISSATGGELTGPSKAVKDEPVTLTVTPTDNYVLSGITVTNNDTNESVEVAGAEWYSDHATFTMPDANVTVTPTFTTETANLSINMPKEGFVTITIPSTVTSFKIYDDGGADGNYSDNSDGYLVLKAPDGKQMMLTGTILTEYSYDHLTVYRGTTDDYENVLLSYRSSNVDNNYNPLSTGIGTYSATEMLLKFYSNDENNYAGLDLTVRLMSDEYENPIFYVDADGEEQMAEATLVTYGTTTMGKAGETTWYNVSGIVNISDRIELAGTVNLILTDGCELYANYGMHLPAGNTLNVFTQSSGSGKLSAWYYDDYGAAIGGNGGNDENGGEDGGVVNVYGGIFFCNGLLGGGKGKTNGTATINLSWTNAEDAVFADPYNGKVTLLKDFTNKYGKNYVAGVVTDYSGINDRELLSGIASVFHARSEASCTQEGYAQDCWYKIATQKYYADKACTQEIDKNAVLIPATGHVIRHTEGAAATFSQAGSVEYWYCERCRKYYCDEKGEFEINGFDPTDSENPVDLTFGVEGNATDGYYVRMPKYGIGTLNIDDDVTSFKIYDDGGADKDHSNNCNGRLVLKAPEGKQVMLSGNILSTNSLTVFSGTTVNYENYLWSGSSEWDDDEDHPIATSIGTANATTMLLRFQTGSGICYAGLDLTAELVPEGYNLVSYVDANGEQQIVNATPVTNETKTMGTAGETTWYCVQSYPYLSKRIELAGTVNLILTDYYQLEAEGGLHLPAGSTLNVFTQSKGRGKLIAGSGDDYEAAIGGNGGDDEDDGEDGGVVNIYGGMVSCNGPLGGGKGKTNGTATINLSWTNAWDAIDATQYNGTVTLSNDFTDEKGNNYAVGAVADNSNINNKQLLPLNATKFCNKAKGSCTENGYAQDCWFKYATQKYYADQACTQELVTDDVLTPKGHHMTHTEGTEATFAQAGTVEYWYCERCEKYFCDEEGKFEMRDFDPSAATDLTFGVEGNATDGYYVRMPKYGTGTLNVDNSVISFKIYDDGGADDNYSDNCNGSLVLKAPDGKQMMLTGTILTEYYLDVLTAYRGTTADDDNMLIERSSYPDDDDNPTSTGIGTYNASEMLLNFRSNNENNYAGLDLTVRLMSDEYENPIFYVDANGEEQIADATPVTSKTKKMGKAGKTTWYCAGGYGTINDRIELAGTVNLILANGGGLYTSGGLHLPAGNTLNVFTQSTGSGFLATWSYGDNNNAVIGGNGGDDENDGEDGGDVNIYGGMFSCDGPLGGGKGKTNGTATINLSWTNAVDYVKFKSYDGTVTLLKDFVDEKDNIHAAGEVADNSKINDRGLLSIDMTIHYAQSDATCAKDGYTQECWYMPATKQFYTDEACTQEIDKDAVIVPALGHDMTHTEGTAATFTQPGSVDYWYCNRCETYFCDEKGNIIIDEFNPTTSPDLTFAVEGNASDGFYVRMPKYGTGTLNIDDNVTTFKIYDDGGANENYSVDCSGRLVLVAPDNKQVRLTGTVASEKNYDYLSVYNGTTSDGLVLLNKKAGDRNGDNNSYGAANIGTIVAPGMGIHFRSDDLFNFAGLDLTATIEDETGVILVVDNTGQTMAVLDGSSNAEVKIESDIKVQSLNLNWSFTANQPSTLMLPFDIDVDHATGATFYTFTGVALDNKMNVWKATMTEVEAGQGNSIEANTPILVVPNDSKLGFPGIQTLNTKTGGSKQTTQGDWTFKGSYAEKTWTAGECGNDYCFAATDGIVTGGVTDVEAGDFEMIAEGGCIHPMRSYLTYTGSGNLLARATSRAPEGLPQRISVILVKADGTTTEIGTITPTVLDKGVWFSLDGMKLNGKPEKKGLFIHNGRKVVVK